MIMCIQVTVLVVVQKWTVIKMAKATIKNLDDGQLSFMWNFLKLRKEPLIKDDVRCVKETLDKIRQALIQKTGGQRNDDPNGYVPFEDVGTYVNILVCEVMTLYLHGGLDELENILPDEL